MAGEAFMSEREAAVDAGATTATTMAVGVAEVVEEVVAIMEILPGVEAEEEAGEATTLH